MYSGFGDIRIYDEKKFKIDMMDLEAEIKARRRPSDNIPGYGIGKRPQELYSLNLDILILCFKI